MEIDALVVGAGVIGLAVARELALNGAEVLVVDSESRFGSATSARNSEVIHAGLYYPQGSLKAGLCRDGRDLLYAYCRQRGVPHARIGKLIFAAAAREAGELSRIEELARAAGVDDLQRLSKAEVAALEPSLPCAEAIHSPSTGIVDSHALMQAYLGDAESAGARLVLKTQVTRLERRWDGWAVYVEGEDQPVVVARQVVNSAGLHAHELAARTDGVDPPQVRYARGCYFTYSGRHPFKRLIYPVPHPGGLGTHLTLDMAGQARFGPDVEWIDTVDYTVGPILHGAFVQAARLIWPDIDGSRLAPGYAGIRPKLSGPGEPAADFRIDGPAEHGLPGLVNLFGIESPGLTASLAIAAVVREKLAD